MKRSKWFLLLAFLFVIAMSIFTYDVSRKTSFPGSESSKKAENAGFKSKGDSVVHPPKK